MVCRWWFLVFLLTAAGRAAGQNADVFVVKIDPSPGSCTYEINPKSAPYSSAGGAGNVGVATGSACLWTAVSNAPWITITAGASGTGSGVVDYTVAANPDLNGRTGTMTVAGNTFTVMQDGAPCAYSITPTSQDFTAAGGASSVAVTAPSPCPWAAVSNVSWVTITSGSSGTGPGTVEYTVAANSGPTRVGTILIADQTFTVNQAGQSGAVPVQIGAFSAGWWILDASGNFAWDGSPPDRNFYFSVGPGEIPVTGDWNGSATTKVGVYRDGTWMIDYNGNGAWDGPASDKFVYFGGPGYQPFVGDWNGSGTSKIAAHKDGTWMIDYNGNFLWDGPPEDKFVYFGGPGYQAFVGDWNGSGTTKIAAHQDGAWLIDYNGNWQWDGSAIDKLIFFGGPGYTPVLGDWNGDGSTDLAAYQDGGWLVDYNGNFQWDGSAVDRIVFFGGPGYTPVRGDWNGSGKDKVGAYRDGEWVIDLNGDYTWNGTPTDRVTFFGGPGHTPVTGRWQ